MKGLIALDIDGTTAVPGHPIAQEVIAFLKELVEQHWAIVFVTGRSLHGCKVLSALPFPYYVAVHNGAIIVEMPTRRVVAKKYLDRSILPIMHEICTGEPTDFVIFSGCEHNDISFYRPQYFSDQLLEYLRARSSTFQEVWREVVSFEEIGVEQFPSVKCFGLHEPAITVAKRIESRLGLHVPLIRDPFNKGYFVAQATHPDVSKGQALKDLAELLGNTGATIAAGDDYNDCSMLACADISVVMATAPSDMLAEADIIAPPAEQHGLIAGLKNAVNKV